MIVLRPEGSPFRAEYKRRLVELQPVPRTIDKAIEPIGSQVLDIVFCVSARFLHSRNLHSSGSIPEA